MSILLDKTLSMLADQPANKIAVLARENRLVKYFLKEYLPKDWEYGENNRRMSPDSQDAMDYSMHEETVRQAAEVTWNKLTKEQQQQVMDQLIALDPNQLEPLDFHLLDYVEGWEDESTMHL